MSSRQSARPYPHKGPKHITEVRLVRSDATEEEVRAAARRVVSILLGVSQEGRQK